MASCQKVPKFDFQSQFSMSKIIRIFLNFFFIEEYQFKSTRGGQNVEKSYPIRCKDQKIATNPKHIMHILLVFSM